MSAHSAAESVPVDQTFRPIDERTELDLQLFHGATLKSASVAWRLEGPACGPVIVALGGISANRFVVSRGPSPGWWASLFGPDKAVDTEHYRVLSFDYLGGSGDTCGPDDGRDFPSISTCDQAAIIAGLLDEIGIERAAAIVGASYGAMVALAFGVKHSARAEHLVVISGAHRAHPMATAWRSIQRKLARLGLQNGVAREALGLARQLAMTTYRSAPEFESRFNAAPSHSDGVFRFPVEEYLQARGDNFAASSSPAGFLCLSESIDLHRIRPEDVRTPATLIAIAEDQLVPLGQMRELANGFGAPRRLVEISSVCGHDAFLTEEQSLAPVLRATLGELQ